MVKKLQRVTPRTPAVHGLFLPDTLRNRGPQATVSSGRGGGKTRLK